MTAFDSGQQLLAEAALLAHPNKDATIALTVDASDVSIGAVLEQKAGDSWQPLAFLSQQLRPPELKYSTYDCELLSLYLAVKHIRCYWRDAVLHPTQTISRWWLPCLKLPIL